MKEMNWKKNTGRVLLLASFCVQMVSAKDIYVSPKGKDTNSGTMGSPVKTLPAALALAATESNEAVTIFMRNGCYEISETVVIGNNGHTNNLTIKPYGDEKVSISGGRHLKKDVLKRVADQAIAVRIRPEMRGKVKEIDLTKLGIPVGGLRASGFGRPSSAGWSELFVNESPMRLSRWPNDSTVLIGEVLEAGTGEHVKEGKLPVFKYAESRPSEWVIDENVWISGYFAHGYADDMIRVGSIDAQAKTIHPAQQTVYGFMTGAPWRQWFAVNLVEEIDLPGEYVVDATHGKMYVYMPEEKLASLHVSVLDKPLVAIENRSNVLIEGITFEYGRDMGIYMEQTNNVLIKGCTIRNLGGLGVCIGQGSVTPDKKALRPHAAEAGGERASRIVGDLLGKVYQDVLFNRNGGTNNGVQDCYIYNVGAGGVSLGGGDRASLTAAGNFVENCKIHDYNRIEKSYRPGVWMDGVGNRISKCDIYNAPSMAILFHGNNHVIELCKITNVCGEVDDQGAIYYGRDASERGSVIRYCYFKELSPRHRVTATYHDDGACDTKVYGNVYHRAGSLPVLIGGGHDNTYTNNIFIESPVAIHIDNRMQGWGKGMVAKGGIMEQRLNVVKYNQPPYSTAYPELVNYWDEDPSYPKRNVINGNLFYKIGNVLNGQSQWGEFYGNWATNEDPGFVDCEDPLKGFKPNAMLFERIPGFQQIPFDKIGCTLP